MTTAKKRRTPFGSTVVAATELRHTRNGVAIAGNGERVVGRNGELNASSRQDLIRQQTALMTVANAGHHLVSGPEAERMHKEIARQQRMDDAQQIFRDAHAHREVGAAMGEELYITQQRDGFMRNILNRLEVTDGVVPRLVLRTMNVTAHQAIGPIQTSLQIVRDNWIYPAEFHLQARPYVEQKEIVQNSSDVLEEKYMETLGAFMVQEDRIFRKLALDTANQSNAFVTQVGLMGVTALASFKNQVESWGLTAGTWLVANDMWTDLTSSGFQGAFEPMAQHEIIMTGRMGTLLGMNIKSDAFRHPEHRVLSAGEQYIFADPETLGSYTDRNGIDTAPIDQAITGIPGKGWQMSSLISQTIVNSRAVVCGRRIK